ncbi:formimidoylglutamate deiminase [Actinomadura flavalba]|uniref:formimidoylglutamate deiminase n=1 Tax=Actinomadura flavalba TaxID=1120938 RepID=UPI000363263B|nr:formimidoylglutamate deiminase [Actinomadura flavalba]
MRRWHAEWAWVGGAVLPHVLLEAEGDRFSEVRAGAPAPSDAVRLPGLTLPGFANVHSHAFHRALRGRAQAGRGTFWTWRQRMYAVADRLEPDTYRALATAVFAEMALAGVTAVGEFHYLHHRRDGSPYDDPNAMGRALIDAAADAGVRITLLDACYLRGGFDAPLDGPQIRFGDGTAAAWRDRVAALLDDVPAHATIGAAVHSVRAVPPDEIAAVAAHARAHALPLHVHLSEQAAENTACLAAHGVTPAALLDGADALGPRTVAVHATHLTDADIALLGGTATGACVCPTTERDLADGLGRTGDLAAAGSPLTLGSDQHAVIDLLEEARALELHERLRTRRRGHFTAAELLTALTATGHAALGRPDAGSLTPGATADLVTVALDSVRTAGADPAEAAVYAATAADVTHVVNAGRPVVDDGRHLLVPDVPGALASAIEAVTRPRTEGEERR